MHYKKVEEYDFRVPSEYDAYQAFREKLRELGINFTDQHRSMSCTVSFVSEANFEVNDDCDILALVK